MNKRLEEKHGITLIALIITIIILLILAGISISSLTGSGLFQKAQEATTKYTEAQIKEQIEIAIYNSRMNSNGMIDLEELEKGLLEIKGITKDSIEKQGEDGKLPWIVTVEDWKFKIDEDGEVTVIKGITIPKSLKIVEGTSEIIKATLMSGVTGIINWEVENESIVTLKSTIGNEIEVKAVATSGKTIIKASVTTTNGVTYDASCEITIVAKITQIELKPSELEIAQGDTGKIEIVTSPNGIEIEELIYKSDNPKVTVDTKGNITVSKEVEVGTKVIITVRGKISTDIQAECIVTVIKPKVLEIGDYVIYNVIYTNINGNIEYDNSGSGKYGWRVLDVGIKNEDETYSEIKLIPTDKIVVISCGNQSSDVATWWESSGTDGQRMTNGLRNNFEKIPFVKGIGNGRNIGYYNNIICGDDDGTKNGTGAMLLTNDAISVKNIKFIEINKAMGKGEIEDEPSGLTTMNLFSNWRDFIFSETGPWKNQAGIVPKYCDANRSDNSIWSF